MTTESDAIYVALMGHQQVSTLHDWCTCGAGDRNGPLMDSGDSIRGFRRHLADVTRGLLAQAWDEGKWATYSAEREGRDGSELVNPYRFPHVVTPPGEVTP